MRVRKVSELGAKQPEKWAESPEEEAEVEVGVEIVEGFGGVEELAPTQTKTQWSSHSRKDLRQDHRKCRGYIQIGEHNFQSVHGYRQEQLCLSFDHRDNTSEEYRRKCKGLFLSLCT